tara:strand:- start:17 stop:259 length:243 start_codon:yes stop_codon:yes gene_type:complete
MRYQRFIHTKRFPRAKPRRAKIFPHEAADAGFRKRCRPDHVSSFDLRQVKTAMRDKTMMCCARIFLQKWNKVFKKATIVC